VSKTTTGVALHGLSLAITSKVVWSSTCLSVSQLSQRKFPPKKHTLVAHGWATSTGKATTATNEATTTTDKATTATTETTTGWTDGTTRKRRTTSLGDAWSWAIASKMTWDATSL